MVRGYCVEWFPSVRRLLGNRCIERDQVELVHVLNWYAHCGKESKLVYEGELGSQMAEEVMFYTGPLEDLQWCGELGSEAIEGRSPYKIPTPPVPDDQNADRGGRDENHQSGGGHIHM